MHQGDFSLVHFCIEYLSVADVFRLEKRRIEKFAQVHSEPLCNGIQVQHIGTIVSHFSNVDN